MDIQENVRATIQRFGLCYPGDRVLVAVSGGPDSVALLQLLVDLREELQLHLEVAHLQHGIRGEEAKDDAHFVTGLSDRLGLPFHLKEVSLPEIRTAAGKGNLEALAREERYRFLAAVARARGLHKIATAHTLDDQAETVLMWILRGSGMKGLGGMAPLKRMETIGADSPSGLTIIRPLLRVSKAEILNYLTEKNQPYRFDRTNRDTALLRNWIRLELLPKIRERVDDRLSERLGQQAELMRDEDALLAELARRRLEEIAKGNRLSRDALLAEPIAMQRRLLRLWIEAARGNLRGLDFVHIDELLRLIKDGAPQGRLSVPGGWEVAREYDVLKLVRRSVRVERKCYSYEFTVGSTLQIPEAGGELRGEVVKPPLTELPADLSAAVFDAACLTGPLIVRNFRNGDYLQPLGMSGHKKIKDLFIEQKLPLARRATLPLLVLGQEILWVPGYGRSERAKVTLDTVSILRLKLVSLNA